MNRNDDSIMASGVRSGIFGNDITTEANEEAERAEREFIEKIVPNAQEQVDALNIEVAQANNLVAFVNSLGGHMPSDVDAHTLQVKLEARYSYIVYLLNRKADIVNMMAYKEHDLQDNWPTMPLPKMSDVFQAQVEPEPATGLRAVIRRMFGKWRLPM